MTYILSYLRCFLACIAGIGCVILVSKPGVLTNFVVDYMFYLSFVCALAGPVGVALKRKSLVVLLPLIFISSVQANELSFGLGLGIGNSAVNSSVETKVLTASHIWDIYDGFYAKARAGYFSDKSGDPTRQSSGFGSFGLGMLVDLKPIEVRVGYGLAAITTPDSYLGGQFPQFSGDLYLGVRDRVGNGIGVSYQHISSAGIWTPNVGRDFMILEVGTHW